MDEMLSVETLLLHQMVFTELPKEQVKLPLRPCRSHSHGNPTVLELGKYSRLTLML